MTQKLILVLGDAPEAPIYWARFSGVELIKQGQAQEIADIKRQASFDAEEQELIGVMPGQFGAISTLATPPQNQSKFLAAARLLLEDDLAEPIDNLHVVVHRRDGIGVATAVKHSVMEQWTSALIESELFLDFLFFDFDCLGAEVNHPVVFMGAGRMIGAFTNKRFSTDPTLGVALLKTLPPFGGEKGDDNANDIRPRLYSGDGEKPALKRADCDHLGPATRSVLAINAAKLVESKEPTGNLLQGPFKPAGKSIFKGLPLRRLGALAASLSFLVVATGVAEGLRDRRIAGAYQGEARRIHEEYFPNAPITDMRANARKILASGGSASFVDMVNRIEQALIKNDNISIDRIVYDASRSQFLFSLRSESNNEIDAFRSHLAEVGVSARDTTGYRRLGSVWVGEMSVSVQ